MEACNTKSLNLVYKHHKMIDFSECFRDLSVERNGNVTLCVNHLDGSKESCKVKTKSIPYNLLPVMASWHWRRLLGQCLQYLFMLVFRQHLCNYELWTTTSICFWNRLAAIQSMSMLFYSMMRMTIHQMVTTFFGRKVWRSYESQHSGRSWRLMLLPCNRCVCMITVKCGSNSYEASTLRTISSEYNRILQITPLFSNLNRMGGR
jgi:hypothetical protein